MPALTNPRWERFAQAIVAGLSDTDRPSQAGAYRMAGYSAKPGNSSEVCASKLLRFAQGVAERIHELQAIAARQAAKRKQVTIETIADELDEARRVAKDNDQASAMVSATQVKGKLFGLFVEKTEQGKPGDFSASQTTDELAQAMLTQAGASNVTQDMKAMAIAELERHARVLASIAAGESSSDLATPSTSKRQSSQLSA